MNKLNDIFDTVQQRNTHEKEYLQTLKSIIDSLKVMEDDINDSVFKRLCVPERIIIFSVPWLDDKGNTHVNQGYRVQHNSALGPYKGGLRFHPKVSLSALKALALEQTLKNSLTGLSLGGAKGGSDFDPKNKSQNEIMRFCQSFMNELYRHIGPTTDIPAGDMGVGNREIGYLFGQYKRLTNTFTGTLTGKDLSIGGSILRPEATGFGLLYFVEEMLKHHNLSITDKSVIISGSGNVALGAATKTNQLGAKVVAMSDSDGVIYDPQGLDIETLSQIKFKNRLRIKEYLMHFPQATYLDNPKDIWNLKCDIALACATENEIDIQEAQSLIDNKCLLVAEGSNRACSNEAIKKLNDHLLFGPAKAANAGGVIVSSFEMSQNSTFESWTAEQVDQKLKSAMQNIFKTVMLYAAKYNDPTNYVLGANVAAYQRLEHAMNLLGI